MQYFGIVTLTLVIAAVICVIVWDSIAQAKYGITGTLSYWIWKNSSRYPEIIALVCAVAGFLAGHLFWSSYYDNAAIMECAVKCGCK